MHKNHNVFHELDWNAWWSQKYINNIYGLPQNAFVTFQADTATVHGIVQGNKIVPLLHYSPCGISPKNAEQQYALNILKNPHIALKILNGSSGSGKTLLACAHAMQTHNQTNKKIVIAKSLTPVGREIGFLKGDMNAKVMPWLGPFMDNFMKCGYSPVDIETMIAEGQIEITPITFIQGRSISNAVIIIDEVQNLDMNTIKQVITRAADNTEVILLGDPSQKFEYRNRDNTIEILTAKAYGSSIVGVAELKQSVRSPLASWAVENL
jgi:PhoH-like ATPase